MKSTTRANELAERLARLSPEQRQLLEQRRQQGKVSGYGAVARALQDCGITHLYCVAGKPTEPILAATVPCGIRPIGVYHQTAAVCMATAHNYQCGRLDAAALVSAGPAVTNAMTGLMAARENGWPVVVLGGKTSLFQNADLQSALRNVTKETIEVTTPGAIAESIWQSCRIARSGFPGPVYLELHEDVLGVKSMATLSPSRSMTEELEVVADDEQIERVAEALMSAPRPALLLGKGIRWTVAPAELQSLIERVPLPFATSPMARGFVPDDHPLCFNSARSLLQSTADTVLVLGARLNWVFRYGAELSRQARVFQVGHQDEELRNTSIDVRRIVGDSGNFVSCLMSRLEAKRSELSADGQQRRSGWLTSLGTARDSVEDRIAGQTHSSRHPMCVSRMMRAVREALPRNAILVTDGNVSMLAAQRVIPSYMPASRLDAGTNGCMGVGIPYAIGAKVANPKRPVVALVGDYAFSLSAMEMEVCLRQNIPIIVIVANNQGNNGALKQTRFFPHENAELVTMFQPRLHYDQILKTFGGKGATIDCPDQLTNSLRDAIAANESYCFNVIVDPSEPLMSGWASTQHEEDGVS